MNRGGIYLVTAAILACSACLGDDGRLEIRSATTGLKAGPEPVPFRIAEARNHLALGNVALALEGFRKAAREDPASVDALAGTAQCYDQMNRFDLSRRYYEQALALAPREPALLALLASSLDRQGQAAEAALVRREMAALIAVPAATPAAPEAAAPVGQSVTIALAPPRPIEQPKTQPAAPQAMTVAPVGRSVTIALPPPPPPPARAAPPVKVAEAAGPRLERLSLTEVALFTTNAPRWKKPAAEPVRAAARAMPKSPIELRVLNAARVEKLAARTRAYLGRFGWRSVAVGDAAIVRRRSLIVYPQGAQEAANRLSAKLGFAAAQRADVRQLTLLLGRDAAEHPALRPKA